MALSDQNVRSAFDVVVIGEYYFDLIFRGLPGIPTIGTDIWAEEFDWLPGASFSTALAFSRLGTRAGWWCTFGNDIFSRMIVEEAQREGIPTDLFQMVDRPLRRVSTAFSLTHDRGFMSYSEEPEALIPREELYRLRPRVLLLQGFSLAPERLALIEEARRLGIVVCSDCQHIDMTLDTPSMRDALSRIDVFLPNAKEAIDVTGAPDAGAALAILSELCPTVVVKCGADGAIAMHEGRRHAVPALAVDVFDTTGAGDCFNAGFVHGFLNEPYFETAVETGVICGSLAVTGYGGRNLPFLDDIPKYRRAKAAV
ncbi:MAG: carbohydrate kinase family protein [Shinella sp.]|nr:carbohydrate kinase family protein [Shinella sp.]